MVQVWGFAVWSCGDVCGSSTRRSLLIRHAVAFQSSDVLATGCAPAWPTSGMVPQGSRQSGTALPQSSPPSEAGGSTTSAFEGWALATVCLTAYQHTGCLHDDSHRRQQCSQISGPDVQLSMGALSTAAWQLLRCSSPAGCEVRFPCSAASRRPAPALPDHCACRPFSGEGGRQPWGRSSPRVSDAGSARASDTGSSRSADI